ncbi:MAG: M23 family metallopeptidase [Spirochaetota bacterium]
MVRNAVPPAVVELRNGEGGTITAGEPIAMAGVQEWRVAVYLLGVDSTTHPGDYVIVGMNTAGAIAFAQPLEIVERDFRSEEIPLTPSLTSLRDEPDPRKTEQTRVLTELILSRDPDAVFHTGPLGWPLPPETRRTSLYGDRRTFLYADGRRARAIHVGLDFASPVGTTVVSSGSGVVRMARDRIVTGKTVVIEHLPGVYSLYYHLDELAVEEGRTISQGDVVGTVGATGLATGPHLHWEVRVGGVAVSPEAATESPLLLVWPVR